MVIDIPGFEFRIKGQDTDWAIQYKQNRADGGESWNGRYFFSAVEHAIGKVYDLMLQKSEAKAGVKDAALEFEKNREILLKAVEKAARP